MFHWIWLWLWWGLVMDGREDRRWITNTILHFTRTSDLLANTKLPPPSSYYYLHFTHASDLLDHTTLPSPSSYPTSLKDLFKSHTPWLFFNRKSIFFLHNLQFSFFHTLYDIRQDRIITYFYLELRRVQQSQIHDNTDM